MKTKIHSVLRTSHFALGLALLSTLNPQLSTVCAQGTAFTYQGRLNDGANPANGSYDLRFYLRDALAPPGNPVGATNTFNGVTPVVASNGLFTVSLDFGPGIFTGPARWLEIGVRTNGSAGAYTTLSPRQPLTPTPYAIYAANAAQIGGQAPTAFVAKAGDTMSGALTLPADGLNVGSGQLQAIGGRVKVYSATVPDLMQVESLATTGTWLSLRNSSIGGNAWSLISSGSGNGEGPGNLLFNNGPTRMVLNGAGELGIGSTSPLGMLEIQGGADTDGLNDPHALSLAHHGGGYRHWIISRHNSAATGNAIDFYLNTSGASGGSSAPGTGNVLKMTLDSVSGIKAVGGLVIENRTSDPPAPVAGQIWLRTDL